MDEFTSSGKSHSVENVQALLVMALTDRAGMAKQQSMLFSFMVWVYHYDTRYTCPDKFQHVCVYVKYALKCAAFSHMQSFKKAAEDKKFVDDNFRNSECAFQEIEYMKKLARRCYCYIKPEKIRWLNPGVMQVNTKGTIWVTVEQVQIKDMISGQLDIVETIFGSLGIAVISSEEMQTVKDTDNVAIGHGLWTLNKHLRTPFVDVPDAQEFLMCDTKLGVALGFAASYSGGGAMRVPEVNEISFTRLASGSVRSLRFNNGPLGGRCAITYDYTKSDSLMGSEAIKDVQTTMKFAFERLSRLMLTHAIRFKPQAISVALHACGRRGAMCHGSMLAVEMGDRMSNDSLRYMFNTIIEKSLPGLSVGPLRHVIEAVSLQAADGTQSKIQAREDMRQAMIALSAHSARTSDGRYAGDQYQVAGIPRFHVEKYHRAAIAFNAHIGLEFQERAEDDDDFMHAAWAWIQEFRPEVAAASLNAVHGNVFSTPAKAEDKLYCATSASSMSLCDTQPKPGSLRTDLKADEEKGLAKCFKAPSPKRLRMHEMSQCSSEETSNVKRKCQESQRESQQSSVSNKSVLLCQMQEKEQCQGQRKGGNNVNIVLSSQSTSAEQRQFSQLTTMLSQGSGAAATAPTATATQQAGVMGKLKLRPVQATTLGHMAEIRKRVNSARVLVVQPCGTGKSLYFTNFAKTKDTIVILAQPFVSLTQQTTTDAITSKISTSTQAGIPLKQMVLSEGLLIISSYEKLHTLVFCLSPFYLSIYGKKRLMHLLQGDAG